MKAWIGVGTSWFGQVLGFLATQTETSGFEKTQPATRIKTIKFVGFQVERFEVGRGLATPTPGSRVGLARPDAGLA
jgi:hypothetical protein